jgi:hypothetical protein
LATHYVINAVSLTLVSFIDAGLASPPVPPAILPPGKTGILDPGAVIPGSGVTVFLYEVVEDPMLGSRPLLRDALGVRKPPMPLVLRYQITPDTGNPSTDQVALGRIIQMFYDQPLLAFPVLKGVVSQDPDGGPPPTTTPDVLQVNLIPMTLDDRTKLWTALRPQQPFRASLAYEVRVVELDSALPRQRQRAVSRRSVGVIEPERVPS